MSEQQTIVIGGEEYNFGDLEIQTQADIARVAELRREVTALQRQIGERTTLLKIYETQIQQSVKPVEEPETSQGLPEGFVHDVKSH